MLLVAVVASVNGCFLIGPTSKSNPIADERGLIKGLGFSPFRDCQSPQLARLPSQSEMHEDVELIGKMGNAMRTYSSVDSAQTVEHALQMGLRVSVGAWLGPEATAEGRAANSREIEAVVALASKFKVESVIVGNEVVLRKDLSPQRLAEYIREVKSRVNVPVTTAEIASTALYRDDYGPVLDSVDYFLVHIYPYWDNVAIDGAAWYVADVFHQMQHKVPGKKVVIGETGWPSDGPPKTHAVPDSANAGRFLAEWAAVAAKEQIDYYYFAAFDEPWKDEEGVGSHWGMWNTARNPKFPTTSLLGTPAPPPSRVAVAQGAPSASPTPSNLTLPSDRAPLVLYQTWPPPKLYSPSGYMGDTADISTDDCAAGGRAETPSRGASDRAFRVTYQPTGNNGWAGIYWQHPANNWGTDPKGGLDLTGYTALSFYARGERGGEKLTFFSGGIGGEFPDTLPVRNLQVTLGTTWQLYVIDIRGVALTRVSGVFGWSAKGSDNPAGTVFYLDDIQVDQSLPILPIKPTPTPTPAPTRRLCIDKPSNAPAGTLYVLDLALLCAQNSPVGKYDMGVDTSGQMRSWLKTEGGALRMDYPGAQDWGAVFITVGDPIPPGGRPGQDLSHCSTLLVDLRSPTSGASVSVGMKDSEDPDDGSETKLRVQPDSSWKTFSFPLSSFTTLNKASVYVMTEFVFEAGDANQTIYFRNIRFRC